MGWSGWQEVTLGQPTIDWNDDGWDVSTPYQLENPYWNFRGEGDTAHDWGTDSYEAHDTDLWVTKFGGHFTVEVTFAGNSDSFSVDW